MKSWTTNDVEILVCIADAFEPEIPLIDQCQPVTGSGAEKTVTLKKPDMPFNILIIGSKLGLDKGGVAIVDDIEVDYEKCAPADPTGGGCEAVNCDFGDDKCMYEEPTEPVHQAEETERGFEYHEDRLGNPSTGVLRPPDGKAGYMGVEVLEGEGAAAETGQFNLMEDHVLSYKRWAVTEGLVLDTCRNDENDCPLSTSVTPTLDDRAWIQEYMVLPKGTKKVLFIVENKKNSRGAVGVADVQLLKMPESGDPMDASEPACDE
jgi:hypothetical protein